MAFLSTEKLKQIGFKRLGENIKLSDKASIYNPELIEIGDNSRIDDFCILSGEITIGRNVHISPGSIINGGKKGIIFSDYATIAYRTLLFTCTDDYHGYSLTNVTFPSKYRACVESPIYLGKHSIVGAGTIVFPGVRIEDGAAIGAMSLVIKSTEPWMIYAGIPSKPIKPRSKNILILEKQFLEEEKSSK